jgi:predicted TPR repeat methyltransferase
MTNKPGYKQEIVIKLQAANRLKAERKYQEAVQMLQDVIRDDPQCAPAYNNIGAIYFLCEDFQLAVAAYQVALDLQPNYLDAYYNLALAQTRCHLIEEATITYRALLTLNPEHAGARFQLGCIFMRRQEYKLALAEFNEVLKLHPNHFESLANLALCYLQTGSLDKAAKCYWQALELVPEDGDILFNLGVIHMQQGYTAEGIQYYQRAVKAQPDYFDAHHNLAAAFLMRRNYEEAQRHFQEALRIQPDNEALRHTLQILQQDKSLTGSAPAYIRSLFDSYADYYEPHLLTHLHYQVPQKLNDVFLSVTAKQDIAGPVLDLGCGTGLCASLLKTHATKLVGVDLSPNMLAIAAQKNLYDDLIAADAIQYLESQDHTYQLIAAADVVVYFGDLDKLVAGVAHALKQGGWFLFNVEANAEPGFALTLSGRFAHHADYLNATAARYGFTVVSMREAVLRSQDETPVSGYLCVFRYDGADC